jgi:acyl-CoA reductase-like NAD-dependent aldehyde dehydrogenase
MRAQRAQEIYKNTSFETRKAVLRTLLDYVTRHQTEICRLSCIDSGKTAVDAVLGEIWTTCEKLRWTIDHGERYLRSEYRSINWFMIHKRARVEYHPLGVVGAIVSWNYPFHNVIGPIISALFAGNAIVCKVSEYVAWSSGYIERMIRRALVLHHLPEDLVHVLVGYAETGQALIGSGVAKILFIGSPEVGKKVMATAAETLTPVVLELGGKDVAIVCDDCDISQVIDVTMRGTFQNCGQNCVGFERIIVHERIYSVFVRMIQERMMYLTQGPTIFPQEENNDNAVVYDCGAMTIGEASLQMIQRLVDDAIEKGATLMMGGQRYTPIFNGIHNSGSYYQPTLLSDVTPEMKIAQKEVFGPVMVIMKAHSDEDAICLANACTYGLGSSVFSKDYIRAERIGRAVFAGMLNINDFAVNYLCQSLPFGGIKLSGFGRFSGIEGLRDNCVLKAVTTDRFSGIRTKIPSLLRYPITQDAFPFCTSLVTLFYGLSLTNRLQALVHLGKLSYFSKTSLKKKKESFLLSKKKEESFLLSEKKESYEKAL